MVLMKSEPTTSPSINSRVVKPLRHYVPLANAHSRVCTRVFLYLIHYGQHNLPNPLFADSVVLGKPTITPCRPVLKTVMTREYQPIPPPNTKFGKELCFRIGPMQS